MLFASVIPSRPRSGSSNEQSVTISFPAPKRKTHRKSRGGCLPCKARHKRCDERRPLCTSCLVRGRECVYPVGSTDFDNIGQQGQGQIMGSPVTPLSAAPSDPFQVVPFQLRYPSSELSNHFVYYQTRIRQIFDYQYPIDLNLGNVTFFQTALLLAAGHKSLVKAQETRALRETITYHKLEIMDTVRRQIESSPSVPAWLACIVSGLVLANVDNGEYREAQTHLDGLFRILDVIERAGQRLAAWLVGRITILALALILASTWNLPYGGTKPKNNATSRLSPPPNQMILWAEASYFYALFSIEFLRDQMTGSAQTSKGRTKRLDAPVLKWLYNMLSNQKRKAPGCRGGMHKGETSISTTKVTLTEETWIAKIAVGALALTVGSMRPYGMKVDDESSKSSGVNTENQDWLDDWIWARRNSGKPLTVWPWEQILGKITWLETDEGLEFVKKAYLEAEKGQ